MAVDHPSHQQADLDLLCYSGKETQSCVAFDHLLFRLTQPASKLEKVIHHPQAVEPTLVDGLHGIHKPATHRFGGAGSEMGEL